MSVNVEPFTGVRAERGLRFLLKGSNMAGTYRMGYEGPILVGTAGTTAATALTESADWSYNLTTEKGSTMTRGAGTSPPIATFRVSGRTPTITFQMKRKDGDTELETMIAAAALGTAVALRTKSHSSGKGYDGDVTLEVNQATPLAGEQTLEFTATPDRTLREPSLWV